MLAIVWGMQGITYSLQIIYLLLGGSVGTAIYKFLKHKTTRPRPYQVHQVIVLGEDHSITLVFHQVIRYMLSW